MPNRFFGDFNPYRDLIHGDWFNPKGRDHHTGAVYLNGHWLTEAAKLEDVLEPAGDTPLVVRPRGRREPPRSGRSSQGVDPNEADVEINVRQAVFYPEKPGVNYITVRGFTMMHAATPWAPPTAEQIGLIGTHWSKGWIIEDNDIRYSTCVGITLGKHGDEWDNTSPGHRRGLRQDHRARAWKNGWSKENIGHHVVRNNTISHCEQAGIVGSLGAVFSTITGNVIHDIHVRRLFTGAEMAGIKIHAAIDTEISGNHIYHTCRGIWLDWMAQGTRVTGNLLHDNGPQEDLFVEVNHGPFLVDNNLFLSRNIPAQQVGRRSLCPQPDRRANRASPRAATLDPVPQGTHDRGGGTAEHPRWRRPVLQQRACQTSRLDRLRRHGAAPVRGRQRVSARRGSPPSTSSRRSCDPRLTPKSSWSRKKMASTCEITLDKAWGAANRCKLVTTDVLGKGRNPRPSLRAARWLANPPRHRLLRQETKPRQSLPGTV